MLRSSLAALCALGCRNGQVGKGVPGERAFAEVASGWNTSNKDKRINLNWTKIQYLQLDSKQLLIDKH